VLTFDIRPLAQQMRQRLWIATVWLEKCMQIGLLWKNRRKNQKKKTGSQSQAVQVEAKVSGRPASRQFAGKYPSGNKNENAKRFPPV